VRTKYPKAVDISLKMNSIHSPLIEDNRSVSYIKNAMRAYLARRAATDEYKSKKKAKRLGNNIIFDAGIDFANEIKERKEIDRLCRRVYNGLNINKVYKEDSKIKLVRILIANLLFALSQGKNTVALNKSPNKYPVNRYNFIGYTTLKAILDELENEGLIEKEKGKHFQNGKAWLSRIWPTDKLLNMAKSTGISIGDDLYKYEPVELVVLRDENKKYKQYDDTELTNGVRERLKKANTLNASYSIWYTDTDGYRRKLYPSLHAVYNNSSFELGGRLYTRHGQQQIKRKERKEIFIGSQKGIEMDFSGYHLMLMYADKSIQFPKDPYTLISDNYELRGILKLILLRMINSATETQAIRAGNKMLMDDYGMKLILDSNRLTVRKIIDKFKQKHERIKEYFFSRAGLKLMNKDAKIALDIVSHFIDKGIPILPVHDSFIVQAKYSTELKQVMESTYKHHTGGFDCEVKEST